MNRTGDREDGIDRRAFLRFAAATGAGALLPARTGRAAPADAATTAPATGPAGDDVPRLMRFPEKTELILHTDRPPQLETPLRYFRTDLTPNDAFFVRWHLAAIPTSIDPAAYRLKVGGHVEQEQTFSLDDLRTKFEPVTFVAVNQCSGNSRSFFQPRVPGGQWGNGAIGNARWTGVRLRDLLAKAKPKAGALEVSFDGLDRPVLPLTPDFVKTLPFDRANDGEVIVAYAMNGETLPMLNGFPLRLVVPGWFATYWVKALSDVMVLNEKFTGFWMAKAYRVPNNPEMREAPKDLAKDTVPITKMPVRAIIVRPEPHEQVAAGAAYEVDGVAFDAGSGIRQVEVSTDSGQTWVDAKLGGDLGKYSWRRWRLPWQPPGGRGTYTIMARATSNAGETQPAEPRWNRSGYARNVVESVEATVG